MYTLRYISSTSYPFADALILFGLLSRHTPEPSGLLHLGAEVVDSQLKNDN